MVSGVVNYLPIPRRSVPVNESSQQQEEDDGQNEVSSSAKPGILSKLLPRGSTKDKVE